MPLTSPWQRSAERIADRLALALLAVVAVLALMTFRDYGLGWDDYTHAEYGDLLFDLYASGFTDRRALTFVNLYAYGGGFDLLAALVAKVLPFSIYETRRLVGAAVGIVGMAVTWRLGRRVGGPVAGLVALFLLATCPFYYGHMFMNAKDAPFAVAMVVLTLGLVRVFQEYPTPSVPAKALFGISVGLALGTRILGGLGAINAAAALVLLVAVETRSFGWRAALERMGLFLARLAPWLVPAYAVMAVIWPWSVVDPLNPVKALLYFSHFFEKPWRELFGGVLYLVPDMPHRYLPQLLALKLPEVMLVLAIVGTAVAAIGAFNPKLTQQRRAMFVIVAMAAAFPILVTFVTRPAMYNGIRHFIFLAPPIAVLGGLAGGWLIRRLAAWTPAAAIVAGALIAVAGVPPAIEMVRLHPYQYTHFNITAGGVAGARGRYMLDYWGLSFKQATEALRAKLADVPAPAGRRWRVATCGPHPPAKVGLQQSFEVGWDPRGADFAMVLGEYYCRPLDAPVFIDIVRAGVVFARVYDIRGRDVDDLLSIPAP